MKEKSFSKQAKLEIPKETFKIIHKSEPQWWNHFIAGAVGGSVAAICTCPLEVLKTRQQTSSFKINIDAPFGLRTWKSFVYIVQNEGFRSLWKGIFPILLGVAPARALHFTVYSSMKKFLNEEFQNQSSVQVNLISAISAGSVVVTLTAPMWLVKTRMQLQTSLSAPTSYKSSFDCVRRVYKEEGFRAFFKGLTASYVGISEMVIQFVLYDKLKAMALQYKNIDPHSPHAIDSLNVFEYLGLASVAKLIASISTYPHEVIRTRFREQRDMTNPKYKGFIQAFKLIAKEEGVKGLYGGMATHLLRVTPNSAILFCTYEMVIKLFSKF